MPAQNYTSSFRVNRDKEFDDVKARSLNIREDIQVATMYGTFDPSRNIFDINMPFKGVLEIKAVSTGLARILNPFFRKTKPYSYTGTNVEIVENHTNDGVLVLEILSVPQIVTVTI